MKYFLLTIVFGNLVLNADLLAQQSAYFNDGEGKQLYFAKVDYAVEGSPYYYDDYYPADITLTNGATYKNIPVKINLQNGKS